MRRQYHNKLLASERRRAVELDLDGEKLQDFPIGVDRCCDCRSLAHASRGPYHKSAIAHSFEQYTACQFGWSGLPQLPHVRSGAAVV